uniref:Zinc finger, C4 type n=1 Tax=Meloidogyne javanica TaxID=6303 RepID=A0A915N9F2_MELJA
MGNPSTLVNSPSALQNGTVKRAKRKASGGLPIGANGQIQADCLICSDRATGKHYGSVSCDGCKGFFRRTIRKKHIYVCRFNSNCVVDKNQRNSCRRCRFEKCLINGMRPEAVQLERDRIAATRRVNFDNMKLLTNTENGCESNDAIWLANDRCVPRDAPKLPDVNRVVARILDHLTAPMRRLHLEDREFVALKAVAFFDPMAKDIEEPAKLEIEKIRQQIMLAFEYQVTNKVNNQQLISLNNRLANLLLLLPPLMAIGRDLVEEAQLAKLFGLANVDELMAELLLPEDAETRSYSRLRTSVTSSIVQSNVTSPNPPATSPQILQIPGIVTAATANNSQSLLSIPTYSSTSSLMLQIGCCSTLPLQQQQNSFGNLQNK